MFNKNCINVFYVCFSHHIPVRLSDSPKVSKTWLQVAQWCGNTTTLVMVADNNIYIRYSPVTGEDFRLTSTGQPSLFYNGVPDWLYQGKYFAESKSELNLIQSLFTSEEEPLYHEHVLSHFIAVC